MLSAQSAQLAAQSVQLHSQAGRLTALDAGGGGRVDVAATTSSIPGGAVAQSLGAFAGDGFLRWALASGK